MIRSLILRSPSICLFTIPIETLRRRSKPSGMQQELMRLRYVSIYPSMYACIYLSIHTYSTSTFILYCSSDSFLSASLLLTIHTYDNAALCVHSLPHTYIVHTCIELPIHPYIHTSIHPSIHHSPLLQQMVNPSLSSLLLSLIHT